MQYIVKQEFRVPVSLFHNLVIKQGTIVQIYQHPMMVII